MIVDCKKQDNFHINRTPAVELYFKEIRKYPVLSSDEQRELLIKAKDGDMCARDKLVKCNQLFVASIAKKYQTDGNFLDIVNEGNIGLLIAIDKFDLSKGNGFLTYAVGWVRKKINEYNASVVKMVKTKNATKLYTYVRKIRNEFFVTNERYPTTDEIRDILRERYDVHVKDKSDLEVLEVSSIYESSSNRDASDPGNANTSMMTAYYEKSSSNNVEDEIDVEDTKEKVRELLSKLDDRARRIIEMLYGINNDYETTPESIAESMGISVVSVKKIVRESLFKMRTNNPLNI